MGSLIGPWIIGDIVQRTGSYDEAIKLLGAIMCMAAAMAWSTRGWGARGPLHVATNAGEKYQQEQDATIARMLDESSALEL